MHPFFEHFRQHIHRHHHAGRGHFRHHHGFGFSPEHGFGGDPLRHGVGRGRKLGSADLQLLLLALLAEKPSHGYELIKALDERSNGYYSPSPGMVYPALTYLEEIGHASVEAQGSKKLYSITEAGLTHVEQNRAAIDALLGQMAWIGQRMDDLRRAMAGGGADDDTADFDAPLSRGHRGHRGRPDHEAPEVRQARRNLKSAMIEKSGADADEQRRIAEILERAATEIRGG
ncbi:MAG: PadR family transcriptional regulator [Proteobacteria bacterium]|nr:PadR family transcriptional regulator [Pseudomonadota bacterium]